MNTTATKTKMVTKKAAAKQSAPKWRTLDDFPDVVEALAALNKVNSKLTEIEGEVRRLEGELRAAGAELSIDLETAEMLDDHVVLRRELDIQRKALNPARQASRVATERHRVASEQAYTAIAADMEPERQRRLQAVADGMAELQTAIAEMQAFDMAMPGRLMMRWTPPQMLTPAFQQLDHQLRAGGIAPKGK